MYGVCVCVYVRAILSSVLLHSKYFKVVQSHVAHSEPASSQSDSWLSCFLSFS